MASEHHQVGLNDPAEYAAAFDVGATSHPGRVRQVNEDSYLVAPANGIFAVADGMGGHEAGALASATVVQSLETIGTAVSAADLLARLEDRILRANMALHEIATQRGKIVGSTVAILLTFEDHFACVWSGDSRIYRARDGAILQLSRDHTEVRDLLERGLLTPEEAKVWPRRNVITRAIGVRAEPELELEHGSLVPGDVFVICSDGLTGHVEDHEILACVGRGGAQQATDALVELTLERGATDNVTVVVVRFEGVAAKRPAPDASDTVVIGGTRQRSNARAETMQ
ncbi:serine/threonine-protein phosphatase [Enterovirga sp. DB1703]|uniref:Serine/threonine-protein phosphatase n=2 Tax=Enterovirga aerilata TaxID=2730920 RepID=A0A849IFA5_9HYPH|nr:serine/threonine-protein phosphatase [Enterovirga sp. DB1703]